MYGANPDLKPEESSTVEGGVQPASASFDIRAVYFAREIKDIMIYGSGFQMVNLDKQKDHGFELEPTSISAKC